ncbi:MAG: hypothetical protein AAGF23_01595 [Acidobacteriota bacterium]
MPNFWTRYVCGTEDEPPSPEAFEQALEELAKWVRHDLRRRNLYSAPPHFLGIVGRSFKERDTFTDLLHEAYAFCVLDRIKGLRRRARTRNIDGAVRQNVRHFLHERQRRTDPVGYRVFEITRAAAAAAIRNGDLETLYEGDLSKLPARAQLAPPPFDFDAEPGTLDDALPARWCESLMPDLVTAFHTQGVIDRMAALMATLADADLSVFLLRDLTEPLKAIARRRAVAVMTAGAVPRRPGDGGEGEETGDFFEFPVSPRYPFEERQVADALLRCVRNRIEKRQNVKERGYLHRLLDFLAAWSAMMDGGTSPGRPGDADLARRLEIPRGRLPELHRTLSQMTSDCRGGRAALATDGDGDDGGSPAPQARVRSEAMDRQRRHEALRRATAGDGDVRRDVDDERSGLRPGSVVVWRQDPEATQWLVTRWRDGAGQVVPVDDAPWHGSRDFDLSGFVGEPLRARCGAATAVRSSEDLEAVWRLPREVADEALDALASRLESLGRETPAPLEIDGEAIYRQHLAALERLGARLTAAPGLGAPAAGGSRVEPAPAPPDTVRPFAAAGPGIPSSPTPRMRRAPWLAAAACAVAALGLGLRTGQLQNQLQVAAVDVAAARLELEAAQTQLRETLEPSVLKKIDDPITMQTTRGAQVSTIEIPPGHNSPWIAIDLYFPLPIETLTDRRFEVFSVDPAEALIFEEELFQATDRSLQLAAIPREYKVVYRGVRPDGSIANIHTRILRIRPAEERFTSP